MVILQPRQEAFARAVASGSALTAAARAAGYTNRYALSKSAALARKPAVARRVAELRGEFRLVDTAAPLDETRREDKSHLHPDLAELSIPELRARVVSEAWELVIEAKAARDRRTALQGLSLIADATGLKSHSLKVGPDNPLDNLSAAQLQALIALTAQAMHETQNVIEHTAVAATIVSATAI